MAVLCGFAFQRAALFRATVLALEKRPISASLRPLDIYIYAFGSQSCATRLVFEGSARLRPKTKPRMAPLVEFGAVLGASASLPLPAPPLPSSSRRYAPQCFVGEIPPPRLATCLTAHPTNRVAACRSVRHSAPRPLPHLPLWRVSFRSLCARRRSAGSLSYKCAYPHKIASFFRWLHTATSNHNKTLVIQGGCCSLLLSLCASAA